MTTRRTTRRTTIWLTAGAVTAAALAATAAPAAAQEKPPALDDGPAAPDDLAAETAYLKALFAEKELKDFAKAEPAYATVASMKGASKEVVARSMLGRIRCLRALGRDSDADALLAETMKQIQTMKQDLAAEFAALQRQAPKPADASMDATVADALEQGSNTAAARLVPFGDRAVPALEREILGGDPNRAGAATSALCAMDSPRVREALARVAASPDSQFPREFAGALTRSARDRDEIVRLLRSMPDAEARRAGYRMLLQRQRLRDESVAEILADTAARPSLAQVSVVTHPVPAQLAILALASGDSRLRAEALEGLAAARGSHAAVTMTDEALAVWFSARPEALRDPEAAALLAETVFTPKVQSQVPIAPAVLRALAAHAPTAPFVLRWMTSPNTPNSSWDVEALLVALDRAPGGTTPWNPQVVAQILDAKGLVTPETLRRLAGAWTSQIDFAGMVLQQTTTLRRIDGPMAEALLDPAHRPAVLQSVARWIGAGTDRVEMTAEVSVPLAKLVPNPTVGPYAVQALQTLAVRGLLDPGTDPLPIVEALTGTNPGFANLNTASLLAALRKLPAENRARVLSHVRADFQGAHALLPLVADLPGEEVDRRIEELARTTPSLYVTDLAVRTLLRRLGTSARPVVERWIREGPAAGRRLALWAAIEATTAVEPAPQIERGIVVPPQPERRATQFSFDDVEALVLLSFEVAPGALDLPDADVTTGAAVVLANSFPIESRRRLARAALRSKSEKDRRWGARMEYVLRDDDAWDDLLVVAEDSDPSARNLARHALRAIDGSRREMEEFRSLTELRKVRDRIGTLLASKEAAQREAGIAAVVALRSRDWMGELVRLAAEDPTDTVRAAACNALVALGSVAQTPPAAPATPERK